jgi:hypothetical protein
MCNKSYFHKLTVERCQYHLAQLCAVLFMHERGGEPEYTDQTIQILMENLSRDLFILNDIVEDVMDRAA